jgi:hypothetical protein
MKYAIKDPSVQANLRSKLSEACRNRKTIVEG